MTAVTADQIASDARDLLIYAAGPYGWSDRRKSWLARGAAALGIPVSRAESIFYRKTRNIPAHEYLSIVQRVRGLEQRLAIRRAERDAYIEALARAGLPAPLGAAGRDERASVAAGEAGSAGDAGAPEGTKAAGG